MKILEIALWIVFCLYCLQVFIVNLLVTLQQFEDCKAIKSKKELLKNFVPFWFVYTAWKKLPNE